MEKTHIDIVLTPYQIQKFKADYYRGVLVCAYPYAEHGLIELVNN